MFMVKRKVLSFFIVLASFVALLTVLHFFRFGSLTGLSVSELYSSNPDVIITNDFEFSFNGYNFEDEYLTAGFSLAELASESQNFKIDYSLQEDGRELVIGQQSVVLEKGKRGDYVLKIKLPYGHSDKLDLLLRISNGNNDLEFEKKILISESKKSVGFAVKDIDSGTKSWLGFFLIALIFTFFISRFVYKDKRVKRKIERRFQKDFIKLDFE